MRHHALAAASATYVLGIADPQSLMDAAHEALNDGVYSYSLGELAYYRKPPSGWWDIARLFLNALQELEMALPTIPEAFHLYLERQVIMLVEERESPNVILHNLYDAFCEIRADIDRQFDSASLQQRADWMEHHFSYQAEEERITYYFDDAEKGRRINQLNSRYEAIAKQWCQEHWRPLFDPTWLTPTVDAIAEGIFTDKAFGRLPILGDALQEAGCANESILSHCLEVANHTRSCWVVDLILGKE